MTAFWEFSQLKRCYSLRRRFEDNRGMDLKDSLDVRFRLNQIEIFEYN